MITILIPTLNEEKHIYSLLKSLSTYPSISEILVVDGLSKDKTKAKVELFKSHNINKNLSIEIINNPKLLQGYALNLGITISKNRINIRIDAHSKLDEFTNIDYFYEISEKLESNKYSMVGFKQRFMYRNFFEASLFVLSFTYFISKSLYRFTNKEIVSFDTAWLFAIKKEDALSIKLSNPEATPNEDYDFCQRLIIYKNKPILIYPKLPIYYLPRSNVTSLAKQYFKYGNARMKTDYRLKRNKSILFDLSLYISILLCIITFFILTLINLKFYFLILFINLTCLIYQLYMDQQAFPRKNLRLNNLIIGIFISPYIASVPFFFRTLGKANHIIKNLFKKF